jgi:hypothetical protein
MHHPDIHDILITVQDFFFLADDQSNCEIIPFHYHIDMSSSRGLSLARGFWIRRKLSLGWLEVIVMDLEEDSNTVVFEYLSNLEPKNVVKAIEIEWNDYSLDRVQDAVREILIMDKKATKPLASV